MPPCDLRYILALDAGWYRKLKRAHFKGAPPEGVTGGSTWDLTSGTKQGVATGVASVPGLGNYPCKSTAEYLPSFQAISTLARPGPGDGGPTHRTGRRGAAPKIYACEIGYIAISAADQVAAPSAATSVMTRNDSA